MNPKLREIPHIDLYSKLNDAIRNIFNDPASHPYQNCLNCMHWSAGSDLCVKYNQKPPTEILIYSCPSYEDIAQIPF